MSAPDSPGAPPPGLLGSARRLLRTSLGLVATRLQILGTEVEEEQLRFTGLVFLLAGIVFCFFTAALLAVALAVVLFWDTHRVATLVVFILVFLGAGIGGLPVRPAPSPSPLEALCRDARRDRQGSRAHPRRGLMGRADRYAQIRARRERLIAKAEAQRDEFGTRRRGLAAGDRRTRPRPRGLRVAACASGNPRRRGRGAAGAQAAPDAALVAAAVLRVADLPALQREAVDRGRFDAFGFASSGTGDDAPGRVMS